MEMSLSDVDWGPREATWIGLLAGEAENRDPDTHHQRTPASASEIARCRL